jgi:hypothetical protein
MSKHDDLERMARHYSWWPKAKAVGMLTALLEQLKEGPEAAKFTIRTGMKADGQLNPWLCVEGGSEVYEGYDDGFGCPPLC